MVSIHFILKYVLYKQNPLDRAIRLSTNCTEWYINYDAHCDPLHQPVVVWTKSRTIQYEKAPDTIDKDKKSSKATLLLFRCPFPRQNSENRLIQLFWSRICFVFNIWPVNMLNNFPGNSTEHWIRFTKGFNYEKHRRAHRLFAMYP